MKAKDLLEILEHNDPTIFKRTAAIKDRLKPLLSMDKCQDCGGKVSFTYTVLSGVGMADSIVESSVCENCLSKSLPQTHVVH